VNTLYLLLFDTVSYALSNTTTTTTSAIRPSPPFIPFR